MKEFKSSAEAWDFVDNHPKMGGDTWGVYISLTPHLVYPGTMEVMDDQRLNTLVEWWVESGPSYQDEDGVWQESHDYDLDCGDISADKAIIKLAQLVEEKYGDY